MECVGLAERGWEVMLSVPPGSELAKRARAAGLAVDESVGYTGGASLLFSGDIGRFRRLAKSFRPDILHLHGGRDSWVAAGALWHFGSGRPRVVRTKHNVFPIADHFANRWQYGSFFEAIVCLSGAIVGQCTEKAYIDRSRLVLIPSACEAERFELAAGCRADMRREFGFADSDVVVVMSGRLRPEKGHDVLVAAMPEVIRRHPEVRFLLLGSGSLKGGLDDAIETGGLRPHVRLAGFREDVPECLSAADICVQPSRSEGLGTSVLEACAAGLPVVASRTGGIPDIITDGETGLLVEPGSPAGLAEALASLVADRGMRERLGAAAREKVRREFSVAALVEKTDAAYRRILGGG
jgi:glycosyltransferase involved in cell wall biosynthesis